MPSKGLPTDGVRQTIVRRSPNDLMAFVKQLNGERQQITNRHRSSKSVMLTRSKNYDSKLSDSDKTDCY